MGIVLAATHLQLDRKVALKLLRTNLGANTNEARTRLKREAQAIAQLNHPNVVGVYDVGTTDDGDVYIAMEFVEGDTLTTWLKKWPRSCSGTRPRCEPSPVSTTPHWSVSTTQAPTTPPAHRSS